MRVSFLFRQASILCKFRKHDVAECHSWMTIEDGFTLYRSLGGADFVVQIKLGSRAAVMVKPGFTVKMTASAEDAHHSVFSLNNITVRRLVGSSSLEVNIRNKGVDMPLSKSFQSPGGPKIGCRVILTATISGPGYQEVVRSVPFWIKSKPWALKSQHQRAVLAQRAHLDFLVAGRDAMRARFMELKTQLLAKDLEVQAARSALAFAEKTAAQAGK